MTGVFSVSDEVQELRTHEQLKRLKSLMSGKVNNVDLSCDHCGCVCSYSVMSLMSWDENGNLSVD